MRIVICGSFSNLEGIRAVRQDMKNAGHDVFPDEAHFEKSRRVIGAHHIEKGFESEEIISLRSTLMKEYFEMIRDCDVVYILNEKDGKEHIGTGVAFEIGYAYAPKKQIVFHRVPEGGNAKSMKLLTRGE